MARKFKKLTRAAMRATRPGKSITEHGISFARGSDGDGVFSINIMVDRVRVHRVLGRESDGVTRVDAEAYIEQARTDARHKRLRLPSGRKTPLLFAEAVERYVARLDEAGGNNVERKRRQCAQHLTPFFGAKSLRELSSFEIERYKRMRADAGATPATINRELAVLSHLFNKAVEWDWLDAPPARIRRLKEPSGRIVYLTAEQTHALLRGAAQDQNPDIYAFVKIGLHTGMRKSEILSIRCDLIDLDRRIIFVPVAKAGAREQPITPELAEFLRRRLGMLGAGSPWLFPSVASRSGHVVDIRKPFVRSVKRAGLDPALVVRHTLRHTAITHLVQAGVDLPAVQRVSGHKTLAMVARYSHQNGAHIADAMAKLEARIGAAVNPAGMSKANLETQLDTAEIAKE